MCGIFAWWPQRATGDQPARFERALSSLAPRGPDSQGTWISPDGSAYLGHRRLAITGARGAQPLWSRDHHAAVLVNGEFYDAKAWRRALMRDGYAFQTDTDSEILLALYERHGMRAIHELEGEFAFVVWDRRRGQVWLARDRAGIKPLRYSLTDGLAIASEAKAMLAAGWEGRWDKETLAQAMALQYPDPHRTFFEGIYQLAPGESRVFRNDEGQWTGEGRRWWRWFPEHASSLIMPGDPAMRLGAHLERAVRRRLDTEWPVAIHVSGGLDSTAILAMSQKIRPEGLCAFSVGFEPMDEGGQVQHDEASLGQATAAKLGVPWVRVEAGRTQIVEGWGQAIARAEGLSINGHLVAKWMLAKQVHQSGFRVCMSGEGADEALLGYSFFAADAARMGLGGDLETLLAQNPVAAGMMLPDGPGLDLDPVRQEWGFVPSWVMAKAVMGQRLGGLLRDEWQERQGAAITGWAKNGPDLGLHTLHRSAQSWAERALGGYILPSLADAPEAGFGIQGRVPFLDSDLLAEVMRWRPAATGCPEQSKQPLRQWLIEAGLPEVAMRAKHPFQAPPLWGHAGVRAQLRARWEDDHHWEDTPFDGAAVRALMDRLDQADAPLRQQWEPIISTLLSIEQLGQQFNLGKL